MRTLLLALLLSGTLLADTFVEVSHVRLREQPAGVGAINAGRGHAPVLIYPRGRGTRVVVFDLQGHARVNTTVAGTPLGLGTTRTRAQLCCQDGNELEVQDLRITRGTLGATSYGRVSWSGLRRARVLRAATRGGRTVLICAHDDGLSLLPPSRGRAGTPVDIDSSGRRFIAATDFHDCDNDRLADLFVLSEDGRLTHFEERRRGGDFTAKEFRYRADGLRPVALVGGRDALWLIGNQDGRIVMAKYNPNAGGESREIRKLKDIFKEMAKPDSSRATERLNLGNGRIDGVQEAGSVLLLHGERGGRPWVYMRDGSRTASATFARGGRIQSLCLNPARYGWTVAALTSDRELHVLRMSSDRTAPRGWDPFPAVRPTPEPEPEPEPEPGPEPQPGVQHRYAYFPRVLADTRVGIDTILYFVYLGSRNTRLSIHFFDNTGTRVASTTLNLKRGQRGQVALSSLLRRARLNDLDGYAVVTGAGHRDLVAEGMLTRGRAGGQTLRPTWR